LELKINSFVIAKVTGLVQLLVPTAHGGSPKSCEYEEFQDKSCTNFMNRTNRPEDPVKALKLEPFAGIGSPPGTVNLVCGITYVNKNGIVVTYGSEESVLTVREPGSLEFVWKVESPREVGLPVYADGANNIIPFDTQGGIFLFADQSMLIMTQLNSVPNFAVRYILPTNPKISGSRFNQQSIQDFDPTQISVFLNHENGKKVKDGRLADLFLCRD